VLFVLSLVMMLNIIDRQMLAILIEPIKQELDVSDASMGLLTGTSFALLHVVAMIPIASWADRGSRRNLIAWGLGTWSALTVLTGLARGFGEMFWVRLGLGVGEATAVPASHSLVSDLFPIERRATALSMLVLAGPVGQMLAYAGGGWINEIWGWRAVFWVFGVPGLLLVLLIQTTIAEPERGAADGSAGSWQPLPLSAALRFLIGLRSYRHLALAGALSATANYAILIWSAPLWMRVYELGTAEVGTTLALATGPATAAGVVLAGRLADRLSRRDVRWLAWIPALACALALPFALGFALAPSHGLSIAWLIPATLLGAMVIGPVFTAVQSAVWPNVRAVAAAWISLLLTAFGLGIGPPIVGWATDLGAATHGPDALRYALAGAVLCFGWAAIHLLLAARCLAAEMEATAGSDPARSPQAPGPEGNRSG
jgi:MFS family permease